MTTDSRDPFERAGTVLGTIIAAALFATVIYALLSRMLPGLFQ